jgi:hypothetical protein
MTSLIQQRFALERRRLWGLCALVIGGVMFNLGIVLLALGPSSPSSWITSLVFLGWVVFGAVELLLARRRIRDFEAEHGVGAGRQD